MKKYKLIFLGFGFLFSGMIFAHGVPLVTSKIPSHNVIADLIPGSLKANIERIARENGWHKVVWNSHNDYTWVARARVKKPSLVAVMETVLAAYPLQAIFYQGNRVLVIEARTVR